MEKTAHQQQLKAAGVTEGVNVEKVATYTLNMSRYGTPFPNPSAATLWTEPPGFKYTWVGNHPVRVPFPRLLYCFYRIYGGGLAVAVIPPRLTAPTNLEEWMALDTRTIGLSHMGVLYCSCHGTAGYMIGRAHPHGSDETMVRAMSAFWATAFTNRVGVGTQHTAAIKPGSTYIPNWETRSRISYKHFHPRSPRELLGLNPGEIAARSIEPVRIEKKFAMKKIK